MRVLIGGIALLVLAAGGLLLWRHGQPPVREAAVEEFLDRTQGAGRLRFSVVHLVTLHGNGADAQVAVAAKAQTLVPLYLKLDTADYLRRTFSADGAQKKGPTPEAGPHPEDPFSATVLQLMTPAGSTFDFEGILDVHRAGAGVSIALASGGFAGPRPQGDARSAFAGATYLAGDPQDDAKLGTLVTGLGQVPGRAAKSPGSQEPGNPAPPGGRSGDFLAEIAPGAIFRGAATPTGLESGTTLYLEIADVSPQGEVRALLRNEGGWVSARRFQGTLSAAGGADGPMLSLASGPDQAVRGAGPFLEEAQTWSFALHPGAAPGLYGEGRLYRLRFEPLSPQQAAEAIGRLSREYGAAVQAARAGSLYIGTCTARDNGASEPVLLRFASEEGAGGALDARIEATSQSWTRSLHGTIVTNARRSGGEPIRLASDSDGAVDDAPPESVFGFRDKLELRIGVDSGRLSGEDSKFTYQLAAATPGDLERLESERLGRSARMLGVFRPGIAYDGILREEQGFTSHARLEVDSVDSQGALLSARIMSLSGSGLRRDFQGGIDPSGSVVTLTARARSSQRPDDEFDAPFLKTPDAATLLMSLAGNTIRGRIKGDPAWVIEFPVGAFIAAQAKADKRGAPGHGEADYPAFPKEGGAYLLSAGAWAPLPRNMGHLVMETVRPDAHLHLTLNLLDALSESVGLINREKDKEKVPYFEFEGKDARPAASGAAITLLFVGTAPQGRPPVELAPGELLKDGRRRILVMRPTPETISFGETRAAAYVRTAAPGCTLLTTTSALEPGPYVFNADTGYELTID
jgi:hypothetical protein